MSRITNFFTELMRKYLPDPFVFAIVLTLLTMILALIVEKQPFLPMIQSWGDGFWNLLAFTTQMAVILAMGFVLASAPFVDRLLDKIAAKVHKPRTAIVVATLVGAIGCYLNWGFGLVIGSIMARKLAAKVEGVHYPLIIAAAYSGFTLWGLGLSASVPVLISTPGHPLEKMMGVISLSETIFSPPMLITGAVVLVTLPILNALMHPKSEEKIITYHPELETSRESAKSKSALNGKTLAGNLNNSRLLSSLIGLVGIVYIVYEIIRGRSLDLNLINFIILFLGILLLGSPQNYINKLNEGVKTISGIILQFPFYAGIMAIMAGSGLVVTISHLFVSMSNSATLPFWGLVSSFVINFFAPSGGGHWVIQGPFMIDAAKAIGASLSKTSMSVMLGSAWNDLVQPFWILPALALSKLKLKDIMGYTVVCMFWVGFIYIAAILIWGYW
jgi:Short chain fatty acids transporter